LGKPALRLPRGHTSRRLSKHSLSIFISTLFHFYIRLPIFTSFSPCPLDLTLFLTFFWLNLQPGAAIFFFFHLTLFFFFFLLTLFQTYRDTSSAFFTLYFTSSFVINDKPLNPHALSTNALQKCCLSSTSSASPSSPPSLHGH
jgi:hypothetical protein